MEIQTIIIAVVVLIIGCLITYLIMKAKNASLTVTIQKHVDEADSLRKSLSDKETELSTALNNNTELLSEKSAMEKELELTRKQISEKSDALAKQEQKSGESQNELKQTITQLQKNLEARLKENAEVQSQRDSTQKEVSILKEQMEKNEQERAEALSKQLALAKEQLQNATQEILKQREEALSKTNVEQIGHVVTPLKEQLEAIQKQVADNIKTTTDNRASLERAIEDLMKQTKSISDDANNLTKALKNESKTQGTWGEMILEQLLESSGLVKDVH